MTVCPLCESSLVRLSVDGMARCGECEACWPYLGGKMNLSKPEPAPKKSRGDVWALVMKDMEERRQFGIKKYGTPLQAHNGRDALKDLYQELLDAVVYLRQHIEETK